MLTEIRKVEEELIEMGVATEQEIDLVLEINGYSMETLNDIIYVRTGYRDLPQLKGEDEEEEEDEEI